MKGSAREAVVELFFSRFVRTRRDHAEREADEFLKMLGMTGFVILPKEPTEGMIEAGVHGWTRPTTFEKQARDIYRAMITSYDSNQKEG